MMNGPYQRHGCSVFTVGILTVRLYLFFAPRYDTSVDFSNLDKFMYPGDDHSVLVRVPGAKQSLLKEKEIKELRLLCKDENILIGGTKEELVIRMFKEKSKDKDEAHLKQDLEHDEGGAAVRRASGAVSASRAFRDGTTRQGQRQSSSLETNLLSPGDRKEWKAPAP